MTPYRKSTPSAVLDHRELAMGSGLLLTFCTCAPARGRMPEAALTNGVSSMAQYWPLSCVCCFNRERLRWGVSLNWRLGFIESESKGCKAAQQHLTSVSKQRLKVLMRLGPSRSAKGRQQTSGGKIPRATGFGRRRPRPNRLSSSLTSWWTASPPWPGWMQPARPIQESLSGRHHPGAGRASRSVCSHPADL
jgi:hypothetical protein